jgi:hypothetical protein
VSPTPTPSPIAFVPELRAAEDDLTAAHRDGCITRALEPGLKLCTYGDRRGRFTAMLVGDSHSTHWLPALQRIARERGWRLVTAVKAGCRFSAETLGRGANAQSCRQWVDLVRARIRRNPPDAVITMATRTEPDEEWLPRGYVEVWRELHRLRVPVIGIRDTPRATSSRVTCLARYPRDPDRCAIPRRPTLDRVSPLARRDTLPPNLIAVDMTAALCGARTCPAVVDTLVVYRDAHHLTATYARALADELATRIPRHPRAAYRAQRAAR